MRFLLINQFFYPDSAATSQLLTDLARHLAELGHEVRVICGRTTYTAAESVDPPPVNISSCPNLPFTRGPIGRSLSYLSFLSGATWLALTGPRPDFVLTLTTPPALGLIGSLVRSWRGSQHFIWEMDLYPDIAADLGIVTADSWLGRSVEKGFDHARHGAHGIVALGTEMKERLVKHGLPAEKIHVCENWADGSEISPQPFPDGPLTIHYSGNLGLAHEMETLCTGIMHFLCEPRIRFVVAGGGSRHKKLEAFCRQHSIPNVTFKPYCNRAELGASLAEGHIGLVTQLPQTLGSIVPSKTYGIMAAGRPILYIGPRAATPALTIEKFRCGWHIEPGDVSGLISLLERLAANRHLIRSAGERARTAFEQNYDRPIALARIIEAFGLNCQTQALSAEKVAAAIS